MADRRRNNSLGEDRILGSSNDDSEDEHNLFDIVYESFEKTLPNDNGNQTRTIPTRSPYYIKLFKQFSMHYSKHRDNPPILSAKTEIHDLPTVSSLPVMDVVDSCQPINRFRTSQYHQNGGDSGTVKNTSKRKDQNSSINNITNESERVTEGWNSHEHKSLSSVFVRPEDLHSADIAKLRGYAELELYNLVLPPALVKSEKKTKKLWERPHSTEFSSKLFGVPLGVLLSRDQLIHRKAELEIPVFFGRLLHHLHSTSLDVEGIFRKSGSQVVLKQISASADNMEGAYMNFDEFSSSDCIGILKKFLRSLPEPLFTQKLSQTMDQIASLHSIEDRVLGLQLIIILLPQVNRNCIKALLIYFRAIIDHGDKNRMTLTALTRLMWPNLCEINGDHSYSNNNGFYNDNNNPTTTMTDSITNLDISFRNDILTRRWDLMEILMTSMDAIWRVPERMLEALCTDLSLSDNSKSEKKKKRASFSTAVELRRNDKLDAPQKQGDSSTVLSVRVRAQKLSRSSELFTISTNTTAQMIVQEFLERKKRHITMDLNRSSSEQPLQSKYLNILMQCGRLYIEIGCCLTQRCLHPQVLLCKLFPRPDTLECFIKPAPDYHFIYRDYPSSSLDTEEILPNYLTFNQIP